MLEFLRNWLIGIVTAGIAVSLARALAPPGAVRRVVQLAGGLLVLLVTVRPLTSAAPWQSPFVSGAQLERQTEQYAMQAKEAGQSVMKKIIEAETSAYIENEAKTRGLSLRAAVEAETPPDLEMPLPARVRLIMRETPDEQAKNDFADWLAYTLNIPENCQRWEEGG